MFRQIGAALGQAQLLRLTAGELAARLEGVWAARARAASVLSYPIPPVPPGTAAGIRPSEVNLVWDHLIYAYLIENTRADDIIRRVIFEATHGERLRVPRNSTTYEWLRSTEELFFSYGPPLLAGSTMGVIRPDSRLTRRNAYFRMFGMDLNHGGLDGAQITYHKPDNVNRDFVSVFENFLRETWRAIENSRNAVGPNPTDGGAIADLATRLQTMLNERRGGSAVAPNLAREEFSAVAAMSWLHHLVDFDNEVLEDFQAVGTSPEERLGRLGERVGVPAHAHSHSYFILAPVVSLLLIEIESGAYSDPSRAEALFLPATGNPIRTDILTIIDHWSRATGRNLKAGPITASATANVGGSTRPSSTAMPASSAAPASTNGRTPTPVGRSEV
jgi:hypothetical protein